MPTHRLLPLLLGIVLAAAPAYGGKEFLVKNVSPNKAARAIHRAHLEGGIGKFLLGRLLGEIAATPPGSGSSLHVSKLRWGHQIVFVPRFLQGSNATTYVVPRGSAARQGGVVVHDATILGGGVLINPPRGGFRVDRQGNAEPTTPSEAWGWK